MGSNDTVEIKKSHLAFLMKKLETTEQALEDEKKETAALRENLNKRTKNRIMPEDSAPGFRQKFEMGGLRGYIHIFTYKDGQPAEVWFSLGKSGSMARGLGEMAAKSISLGLQHGVPPKAYINAFRDIDFFPNGAVQHCEFIKGAKSFPDFFAKYLNTILSDKSKKQDIKFESIVTEAKEHVKKDFDPTKTCEACGESTISVQGCNLICTSCGYRKDAPGGCPS